MNRTVRSPKPLLRHSLPSTAKRFSSNHFRRADFGQGFTGSYEPGAPTVGPLAQASKSGTTRLTPSLLKEHLDKYVVGQVKAKKVTSVAIYNHYQRIRELRRLEAEERERKEKDARRMSKERERNAHPLESTSRQFPYQHPVQFMEPRLWALPVEMSYPCNLRGIVGEFPGHVETVDWTPPSVQEEPELGSKPPEGNDVTIIEKSNLLLLGPSGVGKTYSKFEKRGTKLSFRSQSSPSGPLLHVPNTQLTISSPPNSLPHPRSPLRNRRLFRTDPSRLYWHRYRIFNRASAPRLVP